MSILRDALELDRKSRSVRDSRLEAILSTHSQPERKHIESVPGRCGGRPCIVGTRIRVQDVVLFKEDGMTPEEIARDFPQVTLADVHAALMFYYDNAAAINQDIREDEELVARMKATNGPNLLGELK